MSKQSEKPEKTQMTGAIHVRRFAPWLLLFAWLAISAAQLWVREIDAVRRGVLGCFSPVRSETAALSRLLSSHLPARPALSTTARATESSRP